MGMKGGGIWWVKGLGDRSKGSWMRYGNGDVEREKGEMVGMRLNWLSGKLRVNGKVSYRFRNKGMEG